jgi:hypothetical protein
MCNLYAVTKGQQAIREFTRAMRDSTGNLPPMPAVFPDYAAPVVRNLATGERELTLMRWGFPPPPKLGTQPVTNVRNVKSPCWRRLAQARVARRGPGHLVLGVCRHETEEDAGLVCPRREPPFVLLCGHLAALDGSEEEG